MSLNERVEQELGITSERATQALGALFLAVRMAADAETFDAVAAAFPGVWGWIKAAPSPHGGRTGEMLALTSPETIRRNLATLELNDAQIDRLTRLAGEVLRTALPAETFERISQRLPIL